MRSVRLEPELEERMQRAAAAEGTSVSEFIRAAIAQRAERILDGGAQDQLADVIGSVRLGGGVASRTGQAMGELVARRHDSKHAD